MLRKAYLMLASLALFLSVLHGLRLIVGFKLSYGSKDEVYIPEK